MEREDGEFIPGNDGDNGWTYVSRRGKKTPTARKPSTTSFFFTNIPAGATVSSLWKAFAKHGRVSDIYLAKKKTTNDGNSEDEDESYDDDSDEDLFTNEYLDGGKEQSCGGLCGHLNQETNATMASSEFSKKASPSFPVTFENDATLSPKNISSNIDKVDSNTVVEDCLIKDKSKSTNKAANQKVNYEGLVAVSAFYNGSQPSSRDTCGSNVNNHIEKSDEYYPVVRP
ncbi:RNA-directed DNA polymerase, eukaryota, partial [Tanacetum coccineum]